MAGRDGCTSPGLGSLPEGCLERIIHELLFDASPTEVKHAVSSCQNLYKSWHSYKSPRGLASHSKRLVAFAVVHYGAENTMKRMLRMGLGANLAAIASLVAPKRREAWLSQ